MAIMLVLNITASPALAASISKQLSVTYRDIKIVVDGTLITPKDSGGKTVEPFISNGTTYLPVRAVADALGKEVYWDGPNFTVYLGSMGGALDYPTLRLQDAVNIGEYLRELKSPVDNYGNSYGSAYYISQKDEAFETLLNMKYSRFKGTAFVERGSTRDGYSTFKIEVDGRIVYTSPEITKTSAPINIDISVVGGNDFKIIWSGSSYGAPTIYFGDAGFYQ
jgi:hypothetical protein